MARWSEETTLKFVNEYIRHECLWDARHQWYKNKSVRQAAYAEIESVMNIMGFGREEIMQKIKNIRSTYSQELKKIKSSKKYDGSQNFVYTPNLKWFKLLYEKLHSIEESAIPAQTRLENNTDCEFPEVVAHSSSNYSTVDSQEVSKKRKILNIPFQKGLYSTIASSEPNENEFDLFGRHIGAQLKTLPLPMALEAQQQIQTYLTEYRLSFYRQNCDNQNSQSQEHTWFSEEHSSNSPTQNMDAMQDYDESFNREIVITKKEKD